MSSYIAPVTWNCYGVGVVFCAYREGCGVMDLRGVACELSGRGASVQDTGGGVHAVVVPMPWEGFSECLVTYSGDVDCWCVGVYDECGSEIDEVRIPGMDRIMVVPWVLSVLDEAREGAWAK